MNTPANEETCTGCEHNKRYPNEDVTHTCTSPENENKLNNSESLTTVARVIIEDIKTASTTQDALEYLEAKLAYLLDQQSAPANGFMNADCPKCGKLNMINPPHDCIPTPENEWREELIKNTVNTVARMNEAMYVSKEARTADIKRTISSAIQKALDQAIDIIKDNK
jgi:hypothetical protein